MRSAFVPLFGLTGSNLTSASDRVKVRKHLLVQPSRQASLLFWIGDEVVFDRHLDRSLFIGCSDHADQLRKIAANANDPPTLVILRLDMGAIATSTILGRESLRPCIVQCSLDQIGRGRSRARART
jgi:hypothetical protein